jgi:hypothetical protein
MAGVSLETIHDRHEMINFFDGQSAESLEAKPGQRQRHPLVKSHLLEILHPLSGSDEEILLKSFSHQDLRLDLVDTGLFRIKDKTLGEVGFIERLGPRVAVIYSALRSDSLEPWIRKVVMSSPDLDNVWLSGLTFGVLWGIVTRLSRPERFTRLVFYHDSIYDIGQFASEDEIDENENIPEAQGRDGVLEPDENEGIEEHRATSFRLVDRVGVIQEKLGKLQSQYSPLHAISQLRFPSPVGPGGHDFYDNGKVTNRSPSFRDHRAHLLFVDRIYEKLLRSTEDNAWYSIKDSVDVPGRFNRIVGAPITIHFQEQGLDEKIFKEWVDTTFSHKRNRFRLWGHPIWLGPSKVHVYGVDRHLWQPIWLELTKFGCTAVIPNGTCGNTVHRLVTNIQRFLDPGATVEIGTKQYSEIVEESAQGVTYDFKAG